MKKKKDSERLLQVIEIIQNTLKLFDDNVFQLGKIYI